VSPNSEANFEHTPPVPGSPYYPAVEGLSPNTRHLMIRIARAMITGRRGLA